MTRLAWFLRVGFRHPMAIFRQTQIVERDQTAIFDFFRRPALVVRLAPPSLSALLEEGPESTSIGSTWTVRLRRWGLVSRITTIIREMEEPHWQVEEQTRGPFRQWRLERRLTSLGPGQTRIEETIDFLPPGGLLGLQIGERQILQDLEEAYEGRVALLLSLIAE